jgi:collagenase-like PrtC family protease
MELTLGPVLFEWSRDKLLSFYEEVSGMPLTRVYLGEVICAKKKGLSTEDIYEVGRMLEKAGKKVVTSTLAVVSNEEELTLVREAAGLPFAIEANDMSVFNIVEGTGKELSAGPHIQAYNTDDIEFLREAGAKRFTFPVELPRESLRYNIEKTGVEAEVFAHGKVPLAFSWRCYTSRAFGLKKSACRLDCARYPDGMEINTLKGEPAFTISGNFILSALPLSLIEFTDDLAEIGVKALRVSPHHRDTGKIVEVFSHRLAGLMGPAEALEELKATSPRGFSNGWYTAAPGRVYRAPAGL